MYDILSILQIAIITNLSFIILHDLYHRFDINSIRSYIYHKVTAIKDRCRRTKRRNETREERAEAANKRAEAATKRFSNTILNSKNDKVEASDEENALLPASSMIATQEVHPNTKVAVALPIDPINTTREGVRNRTANAIHKYLPQDRLHRLEETGKIDLLMKNV